MGALGMARKAINVTNQSLQAREFYLEYFKEMKK
jgi:hypothetical protein